MRNMVITKIEAQRKEKKASYNIYLNIVLFGVDRQQL